MAVVTLTIDGKMVSAQPEESILQVARHAGREIPTLCYVEGISAHGGCRMCLVEVEGSHRLQASCWTKVSEGMVVRTDTERLREYRRMVVELLFAEGNHVCSVCVANNHCELQTAAVQVGMDHVDLTYQHPARVIDLSHERFGIDHNRCILCTRCVRTCDELEGAHTWDVAGRGSQLRIVADLDQPWGEATTCTSCGKCFMACPTGAIFEQGTTVAHLDHHRNKLESLIQAREKHQWKV
jgi:bidirectional [NiFe] hydrogenase diaphorase subunit